MKAATLETARLWSAVELLYTTALPSNRLIFFDHSARALPRPLRFCCIECCIGKGVNVIVIAIARGTRKQERTIRFRRKRSLMIRNGVGVFVCEFLLNAITNDRRFDDAPPVELDRLTPFRLCFDAERLFTF